jgi:diguanylate cyclase (GGDEF)-like protein
VARILSDGRRVNDFCARYGGEEFAVVLVDTPKLTASKLAEKLRARIGDTQFPHATEQPGGAVTVSVGVAAFPDDAPDAEALVRAADTALYRAKANGRNCVVLSG